MLNKADIPVLVELPVGTHTQSRPFVPMMSKYSDQIPLEPQGNDSLLSSPETVKQWRKGDGGVLSAPSVSINGRDARIAYIVHGFSVVPAVRPPTAQNESRLFSMVCVGNSISRGSVKVIDSNPFTPLEVQLNLLASSKEMTRVPRCLQRLAKLHTRIHSRFNQQFVVPYQGRITKEYIREFTSFAFHHVGACSVGKVLDRRLRVKGTSNLSVVDASSLRKMTTSAGPMASVYVLAEFVAELFAKELSS